MHFTISKDEFFDDLYTIKAASGSAKNRELFFSQFGYVAINHKSLFSTMSEISDYVENVLEEGCTFEIE